MATGKPSSPSAGGTKAADADLLGEAVRLKPPLPGKLGKPGTADAAVPPGEPSLPEPPPAEDENQPGFIGERNRPAP